MKASTKRVVLGSAALAALGIAAAAPGANAATTGVKISATVLAPVQVTATRTLNFGSFTETGTGTFKVAVNDAPTTSASITPIGGTVQAGGFKIQASAGRQVTVTAPATATITETAGGTATMSVTAFELALPGPASTTAGTLTDTSVAGGSETGYRLGGTLNVTTGQTTGTYQGSVNVTVNYN